MSGKIEWVKRKLSGVPRSAELKEGLDYGFGGPNNKYIWMTTILANELGVSASYDKRTGQYHAINIFFPKEDDAGDLPVDVTARGAYTSESDIIVSKVFIFLHDDHLNVKREKPFNNSNFGFPSKWGGREAFFQRSKAREAVDKRLAEFRISFEEDNRERALIASRVKKQADEKRKLLKALNESQALATAKAEEAANKLELENLRAQVAKATAASAKAVTPAIEVPFDDEDEVAPKKAPAKKGKLDLNNPPAKS